MDVERFDVPRYLSVLPLFGGLDAAGLRRLADGSQLRRFARHAPVCRAGQACEEFHVTVTGQVKLYAVSSDGHEKVIELVGPGCSFGEDPLFAHQPYAVHAQALTDTLLLTVGKAAVLAEIGHDARFALHMLADLSRRLNNLVQDVEACALHSGMQRVIAYLLRARMATGERRGRADTVLLPVTKATIASLLSLTPEYFSRVLRELESAALIEVDRRQIRIPDAMRLATYRSAG